MLEVGCYFRVERDGKWLTLDITKLTDEELFGILKTKDKFWVESLVMLLVDKINYISDALEISNDWDKIWKIKRRRNEKRRFFKIYW